MDHRDVPRLRKDGHSVMGSAPPTLTVTMVPGSVAAPQSPTVSATHPPVNAGTPIPQAAWVADETVASCSAPECVQTFSFLIRRHHCRLCGGVFCAACSSRTVPAANDEKAQLRVCRRCHYEQQLALPLHYVHRDGKGRVRRPTSQGELRLFPRPLLVRCLLYLEVDDLTACALTCFSFYIAARDNLVWQPRFNALSNERAALTSVAGSRENSVSLAAEPGSESPTARRPQLAAGNLSSLGRDAAAQYRFTAFPAFVQLLHTSRVDDVTTYATRVKQLFQHGVRLGIFGAPSVGKTLLTRRFARAAPPMPGHVEYIPTTGVRSTACDVKLQGSVATSSTVVMYDVAGGQRCDSLRSLCAGNSHAILLLYDPFRPSTLQEAARLAQALNTSHIGGTQRGAHVPPLPPIVVCGLVIPSNVAAVGAAARVRSESFGGFASSADSDCVVPNDDVLTADDAAVAVPSCALSLQVDVADVALAVQAAVQAAVSSLQRLGEAPRVAFPTPLDILLQV